MSIVKLKRSRMQNLLTTGTAPYRLQRLNERRNTRGTTVVGPASKISIRSWVLEGEPGDRQNSALGGARAVSSVTIGGTAIHELQHKTKPSFGATGRQDAPQQEGHAYGVEAFFLDRHLATSGPEGQTLHNWVVDPDNGAKSASTDGGLGRTSFMAKANAAFGTLDVLYALETNQPSRRSNRLDPAIVSAARQADAAKLIAMFLTEPINLSHGGADAKFQSRELNDLYNAVRASTYRTKFK